MKTLESRFIDNIQNFKFLGNWKVCLYAAKYCKKCNFLYFLKPGQNKKCGIDVKFYMHKVTYVGCVYIKFQVSRALGSPLNR